MPIRNVVQTVALWRDGKRVVPEVGKAFDFTKEELDQITKLNPDAVAKIDNGSKGGEQILAKTQTEFDAEKDEAIAAAIAKFKKEQGIKDEPAKNDTGAGSTSADKNAGKTDKADKSAKSGTTDKNASADDDI